MLPTQISLRSEERKCQIAPHGQYTVSQSAERVREVCKVQQDNSSRKAKTNSGIIPGRYYLIDGISDEYGPVRIVEGRNGRWRAETEYGLFPVDPNATIFECDELNVEPDDNPRRMDEDAHWATLSDKLTEIRDAVYDVIRGRATGLYLFGRGGTSKTYTVEQTFALHAPQGYVYHNGGLTPQGFFELLEENGDNHADRHLIIDDVYESVASNRSRQYYLAALARPKGNMKRHISYTKQGVRKTAIFRKGIVLISNVGLEDHKSEVLRAMQDRVIVLEHDPTDAETWALIYHVAKTPERVEVADYLWDVCAELEVRPSIRLFVDKAIPLHESWSVGDSKKHWKDRLRSVVARRAVEARQLPTPAQHKDQMAHLARQAWESGSTMPERLSAFHDLTGKSRATAYRYWREMGFVAR